MSLKLTEDQLTSISNQVRQLFLACLKVETSGVEPPHTPIESDFRISEAGACARQLYYKKTMPKIELKAEEIGKMVAGTACHEYFQRRLRTVDPSLAMETPISVTIPASNPYTLSGHLDAMKSLFEIRIVMDIKSQSVFAYKYTKEIKKQHLIQINLYAHFMKATCITVIYVNKDDYADMKIFTVPYDPVLAEETLNKLAKVKECLVNEECPKEIAEEDWECKFCAFAIQCEEFD